MIKFATSCTHTWEMTRLRTHCGTCSQCIDRRFAVLAAGAEDHDPAEAYGVDLLTGERAEGEPRTMLAAYVETASDVADMSALDFYGQFGEASRVLRHLNGSPDSTALQLFELHRQHAKQVTDVVDAALASHTKAIRKRELPTTCLLRLVSDSSGTPVETRAMTAATKLDENVFRKNGQAWKVRFASGSEFILLPSKGAAYLNILLANPGIQFSAVDLAYRVARSPDQYVLGSAGTTLDDEAIKAYEARLRELREDLDKTQRDNDIGPQEAIQAEIDALTDELKQGRGLGNRLRKASDDRDRIRKAVGNAIRRAIKNIAQYDARLAEHLGSVSLRLGHNPLYSPNEKISWDT